MNFERILAKRDNKTVYRDGDKVIKLFNENYPKSDVFNEALNQARVEETKLNIPKLLEVTKINGKWAIVLEYIEGRTLEELMRENPGKLDEYIEFFVKLHLKVFEQTAPLLNKIKDKMNRKISEAELNATTRYDLHTLLEAMPKHNKVCHGDFNPSNVIIKEDGTPYILDWSHATQGNASADVARTYLLFWLAGDSRAAEKYLRLFCDLSDTAKQYVQKWIPIVAASQLATSKKEETNFLMHWINVADYQ